VSLAVSAFPLPEPEDGFVRFAFPGEDDAPGGNRPTAGLSLLSAGDMRYDRTVPNPRRERLFAGLGVSPARVAARKQSHSRLVLPVAAEPYGDFRAPHDAGEADGLATADPGLCLSVTVADCLPIYLFDRASGALALVHSGWRGTGIVLAALDCLAALWGARPADVAVVIGPGIGGCCYAVDPVRAAEYLADFGANGRLVPEPAAPGAADAFPLGPVARLDGARWYLDLPAANARLLAAAGVASLAVCRACTAEDGSLGSNRRQGAAEFTRMVALLGHF
jgi:YfiH family protein